MIRFFACAVAAATVALAVPAARAQQLEPGARAGTAYVPSTHTPGCGGILCDSDDPRRAVGAPPPPPCQGLLCVVSPYGMQAPMTATDVQRMQEERARAAAAVTVSPGPAATGTRRHRKARTAKKAVTTKSVAARTPDPGAAATQAR